MKPHLTLSFNVSILTSLALIRFMEMHGYLPGMPEKANEACKDGGGGVDPNSRDALHTFAMSDKVSWIADPLHCETSKPRCFFGVLP